MTSIKPIRKTKAHTFTPKKNWHGRLLDMGDSLKQLPTILGLSHRQLEYMLAEGQRRVSR